MASSSTTAKLIIEGAIRLIKGARYRASNPEIGTGLIVLNDLIASLSADQVHVPVIISDNFTLTIGQVSYTIGSGGDINTVRPTEIKRGAYVRDSGGLDHRLDPMTREQYRKIRDKDISTRPSRMYYEPSYPLGIIYFNFVPDAAEAVYFDSLKPITEITNITSTLVLPPEYKAALRYNLAVELAPEYDDIKLPELTITRAIDTKDVIIRANSLSKEESSLDSALLRNRGFTKAEFDAG